MSEGLRTIVQRILTSRRRGVELEAVAAAADERNRKQQAEPHRVCLLHGLCPHGLRVNFPTLLALVSVNQRLPSGPATMQNAPLQAVGIGYAVIAPPVVIWSMSLPGRGPFSVNHRLPSGPAVIPPGLVAPSASTGIGNSVIAPVVVIRPILSALYSVNQRLPSGPFVMLVAPLPVAVGNSVIAPVVVIRATLLPDASVNQRLPSGPAVMPLGSLPAVGMGNFVIAPLVVIFPTLLVAGSVNQRSPSGPFASPMPQLPLPL